MKTTGQTAFEAYAEAKGGTTYDGKKIPGWNDLDEGDSRGRSLPTQQSRPIRRTRRSSSR